MAKSKLTRTHSTLIPEAVPLRYALEPLPHVSRIVAGLIKQAGHARCRGAIKIQEQKGCLLLKFRGVNAIQEIRVYAEDIAALDRAITAYADEHNLEIRR